MIGAPIAVREAREEVKAAATAGTEVMVEVVVEVVMAAGMRLKERLRRRRRGTTRTVERPHRPRPHLPAYAHSTGLLYCRTRAKVAVGMVMAMVAVTGTALEEVVGGAPKGRFASDFVRLNALGKGGYGRVWRVRNKLDGVDYAVKIVKIRNGQDVSKLLREVRCMHAAAGSKRHIHTSQLQHKHTPHDTTASTLTTPSSTRQQPHTHHSLPPPPPPGGSGR